MPAVVTCIISLNLSTALEQRDQFIPILQLRKMRLRERLGSLIRVRSVRRKILTQTN